MHFWRPVQRIFSRTEDHQQADTMRLQGGTLLLARGIWVAGVLLALGLFAASMPGYFASLHMVCEPAHCDLGVQLSARDVPVLRSAGISLTFYALLQMLFTVLFLSICAALGLLIFWRQSGHLMGLLSSFVLIVTGVTLKESVFLTLASPWSMLAEMVPLLGNLSGILLGYLFPGQRFAPLWMRWVYVGIIPYLLADTFVPTVNRNPLASLPFLGVLVSILLVQVYRYRFISTLTERQQTKWVIFGAVITLGSDALGSLLLFFVLPRFSQRSSLISVVGEDLITCCALFFPLTFSIALLRYRLYDIDILIRRTAVYSLLTGSLVLIYTVLIVLSQLVLNSLARSLAPVSQMNQSPLGLIGSTLIVTVLFQPLRHRIQELIDRRFYRRKYDAEKTLAAFSAALRNEVDLEQLCEQLLAVVQETMQPMHVSLCLCRIAAIETVNRHV